MSDQTRKQTLKDLAAELRSAVVLQEQAAIQKERAEVVYRTCTWRTEDLIRQLDRLEDDHGF